nr:DUF350 domain-containing protein [Veillonella denticariosi]
MIYISDVLLTIFYACFGILLMLTANTVIDFFVPPGKFSEEIKRGNCAVAWLSAGSFIGIGEILRSVIMSPAVTAADTSLLHGVVASIVYAVLGIVLFVTGYMFINLWHRKYNLSEEIMGGNTAAGILVFGIFVGLALVVSGAVH